METLLKPDTTGDISTPIMQNADILKKLRCLSVVMPVYNEIYTLKHTVEKVLSQPFPKELIIVDDFSTDGTRGLLKSMQQNLDSIVERHPGSSIKIFYQEKNQGKGAALRRGFEQCTGDVTIVQDADLEYDPSEFIQVIEPILSGDADVVYGSRFSGERRRILYFWHQLGNKFLTFLSNVFTNLNISDMETCYKAFKTEIIQSIPIRSNRFGFEPEITAKVAKLRCAIYEVPISYKGRSYSEGKKINWKDGISAVYTILKYWLIDDLFKDDSGHHTLRIMEGAGKYNAWLFNQCAPYLGQRVIEAGSGVGNMTKFLLNRDAVMATDISSVYIDELKRSFASYVNVKVGKFDLLDRLSGEKLRKEFGADSLVSMNVMEHIEDDYAVGRTLNSALPEGGRVVLVVPAHQWCYSKMDENLGHYRRYDEARLRDVLHKANFEIEQVKFLNMIGALGWFFNGRILRKQVIPSRQLRAFDLITKTLAIEKFVRAPFGLSLLIVGKKIKEAPAP